MASAKSVEEMLTSDVDESAVSALVGSLESQLASPTIHLTSQDISSSHNHVNSISSTDNSFVSSGATNNRIGLAVPSTTTAAGGISSVAAPLASSGPTPTPQQSSIPIINCITTTISANNTVSSSVSGSSSNSVTSNVKDGLTRIATLSSNAPLNKSTNISVTAANNIIISNSNLVVVNAAPTSVITSTSITNITSSASAAGNISAPTASSSGIPPPTQQQTPAAFTVTLPGAIPASGYVNQFSSVSVSPQTNTILQRTAIPNGNGPGSIAAALTANKGPSNVHGPAVITTITSTTPVMSVVSGGPKTGPQIRCALTSSANTIAMQNLTNVAVRQQQMVIPTTQQTSLTQQTQNIQGHSTPTVIAVAKSTASTAPPVNMVTQMVSNQQILQGVQIVNMNTVRPGTSPAQGQKTLAPRMVISGGPLRIAGGQQVINARPGAPGNLQNAITLQPNLLRGTLFVKTENGQYQLLTAVGPGTTAGGVAGAGQTYRIQTLPPGSHPQVRALTSQHGITMALPGHPNQQIKMQQPMVHTVLQNPQQVGNIVSAGGISHATAYTGNSVVSVQSPMGVARAGAPHVVSTTSIPVTSAGAAGGAQATSTPQMSPDTAKKKCKNFLSTLIRLASDQPEQVATNVKNLIQGLIDGNVPPEDFTNQLQRELNSSPQPCLIPFLKKSLPYLRHSLTTQELTIDGVRPPPLEVQGLPSTNLTVSTTTGQSVPNVSHLQITPSQISRPTLLSHGPVRLFTTNPSMVGTQPHLQHGDYTTVRIPQTLGHRLTSSSISQNQAHPIVPHASPVITQNRSTLSVSQTGMAGIQRAPIVRATAAKPTISSLAKVAGAPITISSASTLTAAASLTKDKEKRSFASTLKDDDDINDVAAMGGVNLVEESARIMAQNAEFVGTQIRSCKDENFLFTLPLQRRIRAIAAKYGLDEPSPEVIAAVSHATQERLKDIVEKLGVVAEHRMEIVKSDGRHEVSQDVKGQLKFLEELDRVEKKRHEEQEREMLLRAAKSRSKLEDPEQLKLKQKAKEMQRAEMEEMRQREANMTALLAIGPRKKFKVDPNAYSSNNQQASGSGSSPSSGSSAFSSSRPQIMRPRVKRVNLRDLVFILEQERTSCRSLTLYKMMLK